MIDPERRESSVSSACSTDATDEAIDSTHLDVRLALQQIQMGNPNPMAALYDRFSSLIYSIALRILRNPETAEDLLQDVFLHIWRYPERYLTATGNLAAWLTIVTRNRAIDVLRSRRPVDSIEDLEFVAPFSLSKQIHQELMCDTARLVIAKLPSEQRKLLEFAFFEGMTHSEIMELTGLPLGTIKARIRSALLIIRENLEPRQPRGPVSPSALLTGPPVSVTALPIPI